MEITSSIYITRLDRPIPLSRLKNRCAEKDDFPRVAHSQSRTHYISYVRCFSCFAINVLQIRPGLISQTLSVHSSFRHPDSQTHTHTHHIHEQCIFGRMHTVCPPLDMRMNSTSTMVRPATSLFVVVPHLVAFISRMMLSSWMAF